jgi:hypothetical protein
MRTYAIALMLLCAVVTGGGALGAGPDDLAPDTVTMKIDGREYRFTGSAAGSATDLGNGTVRLVIGLRDAGRGAMMQISADIPEDRMDEELHLATHFTDITMVYRSPAMKFMIAPSIQMARDSGMLYYENAGGAAKSRIRRHEADWKSMGREERIASGKGVIRERQMEGSSLFLVIRPVSSGHGKEIRGTFSGAALIYDGTRASRRVIINGGQFRVRMVAQ